MTFAFILGVLPLVVSTGAGNSRHILGTTVIGSILAAAVIAIFIIRSRSTSPSGSAGVGAHGGSAAGSTGTHLRQDNRPPAGGGAPVRSRAAGRAVVAAALPPAARSAPTTGVRP
jgi:hypothetical protein